jgi:hypothetical protein
MISHSSGRSIDFRRSERPRGLLAFYVFSVFVRDFYCRTFKAVERIGPHSEEVVSTLVGSLLGDGWAEKRSGSTRFQIHASSRNIEYLAWLHQFFHTRGYCSPTKPKILKQVGRAGIIYRSCKFRTWSFRSLNWLYDAFYDQSGKKHIPIQIHKLLTTKALAIWLMDDGGFSASGVKISTEAFTQEEVAHLQRVIRDNFDLRTTIQGAKHEKWVLYFPKQELPALVKIVKPYTIPSMHYKLHESAK